MPLMDRSVIAAMDAEVTDVSKIYNKSSTHKLVGPRVIDCLCIVSYIHLGA